MSRQHAHLTSRRWQRLRRQVFRRDGHRCASCGNAGRLECDHVRPLERGGEIWDMGNLQTLCRACHIRKTRSENLRPVSPTVQAWRQLVAEMIDR